MTSTSAAAPHRLAFTKGHGTQNDFVLLTDPDGDLPLDAVLAARLCDRRAGVGADGVIRAVRSDALPEGAAALADDPAATWFMDYRNADGSLAEMCGNGVRVLVAHLLAEGLVEEAEVRSGAGLAVGTRAGVRYVRRVRGPEGQDWLAVDMGPWHLVDPVGAAERGADAEVGVHGLDGVRRPGLSVDVGNPHTVVALASAAELEAADLVRAPEVDPPPPHGTNVELVIVEDAVGRASTSGQPLGVIRMRVHERGSGETRSCGTGACAAALAVRSWAGGAAAGAPERWLVHVPGGTVAVRALEGQRVELAGPAVLLARGEVDLGLLQG
ncbi:diaminopimelate epimerase [Quadrisphaera sp. KR29]|uniref:diaminopimelate epimerase n=1 Tax=Quadrisphaera sp. KR29 TaxID=3461391 RepID=UPI004044ED7D